MEQQTYSDCSFKGKNHFNTLPIKIQIDISQNKLGLKLSLMLSLLLVSTLIMAEPASQVAWTAKLLNSIKSGDLNAGKKLAVNCSACHGDNGISNQPDVPSLAGQLANYTYKQLIDYKMNKRMNPMMSSIAKGLKTKDIIDLAVWFASLELDAIPTREQNLSRAEKLVFKGDGKRTIPPCIVCHGKNGRGEKMAIPALAGQQAEYLRINLMNYKNSKRKNDIYSRMRLIAEQLSIREIEELSLYYQQLH